MPLNACLNLDIVRGNRSYMRDDEFEWDDDKAAANLAKHKVSFSAARQAFDDVFAVEREDDTEDYDEPRFNLLGMVDGRVVVVAYTMKGDIIRIISAREAEPYERRLYHEEN
jgi:uncharacterized DUF497 family protein